MYRVGRSLGRTIYRVSDDPKKEDVFLGIMETKLLAEQVVALMNWSTDSRGTCACVGGLACDKQHD